MNEWSNGSCVGYCIRAMEAAGLKPEQIESVVEHLYLVFDAVSVDEARKIYEVSYYG